MRISLHVKSSSLNFYIIEVTDEGGYIQIICNCKAGFFKKLCKHKILLIKGDKNILYDNKDTHNLLEISTNLMFKSLQQKFFQFESELKLIEKEKSRIKNKEFLLKTNFEKEIK